MKIGFFLNAFLLGSGVSTVVKELASRMAKDHEVSLFTFKSDYNPEKFKVELLPILSRKRKVITVFGSILSAPYLNEIREKMENLDVVISSLTTADFISTFLRNLFQVSIAWSTEPIYVIHSFPRKLFSSLNKRMMGYSLRHKDLVITPCDFVEKLIYDRYNVASRSIYIDGVNFDLFDIEKVNVQPLLNKCPFLEDVPSVLYVGRLAPHKNIETLIKAFNLVKKKIPNVKLVIVGKQSFPNYYTSLKKLVKKLGLEDAVFFTGIVSWEMLPRYYELADVYATASLWEGFLRAEAFAMKTPMVAFDIAANSATIKHNYSGLLVKDLTVKSFSVALLKLLTNKKLRTTMGKRGYNWAKKNLNFDNITQNFEEAIKKQIKL